MITFNTLENYVNAYKQANEGVELIQKGLQMVGNESNYMMESHVDYWQEQMLTEAVGDKAMEALCLWLWDYEMGLNCPEDDDSIPSDLRELYDTILVPAIKEYYKKLSNG